MDEAALLKRLGIVEGPIIAFNVKGGVKEFLRARIKEHGEMNICGRFPDGSVMRYCDAYRVVYGESLEGKKVARKKRVA